MRTMVTTLLVGLSLLTAAPQASAFGRHGGPGFFRGPGGPGGGPGHEARLPLRLLVQHGRLRQSHQGARLPAAQARTVTNRQGRQGRERG